MIHARYIFEWYATVIFVGERVAMKFHGPRPSAWSMLELQFMLVEIEQKEQPNA